MSRYCRNEVHCSDRRRHIADAGFGASGGRIEKMLRIGDRRRGVAFAAMQGSRPHRIEPAWSNSATTDRCQQKMSAQTISPRTATTTPTARSSRSFSSTCSRDLHQWRGGLIYFFVDNCALHGAGVAGGSQAVGEGALRTRFGDGDPRARSSERIRRWSRVQNPRPPAGLLSTIAFPRTEGWTIKLCADALADDAKRGRVFRPAARFDAEYAEIDGIALPRAQCDPWR